MAVPFNVANSLAFMQSVQNEICKASREQVAATVFGKERPKAFWSGLWVVKSALIEKQ